MGTVRQILTCLPFSLEIGRSILQGINAYRPARGRWRVIPVELGFVKSIDWQGNSGMIGFFSSGLRLDPVPWDRVPTINTSGRLPQLPIPSVYTDNRAIGCLAAEHLLELGIASLAYVGLPPAHFSHERIASFVETVESVGLAAVSLNAHLLESCLRAARKPLGVFAVSDTVAVNVIAACARLGIAVPEEVAVIGVDNDPLVSGTSPVPISSVDPNGLQVGYTAARMLEELIESRSVPRLTLVPPLGITRRESSDIVVVGDAALGHALRYIRNHATDRLQVDDICEGIKVSRRTLESRFRKRFNRSLHDEIVRVRIENAKHLLCATDMPIAEICVRSGFRYQNRFNITFKAALGVTPLEYRRRFRLR